MIGQQTYSPTRDWILPGVTARATNLIENIIIETAKAGGVSAKELKGPSRVRNMVWPRFIAMRICRTYTDASLPAIGSAFGGRHHTSVMSALRRFEELADDETREAVRTIAARAGCRKINTQEGRAQ